MSNRRISPTELYPAIQRAREATRGDGITRYSYFHGGEWWVGTTPPPRGATDVDQFRSSSKRKRSRKSQPKGLLARIFGW